MAEATCSPDSPALEIPGPVGLALGAQAGGARVGEIATAGGFVRFRRVAQTPFNVVYEARP
jgi:hypothetical protein